MSYSDPPPPPSQPPGGYGAPPPGGYGGPPPPGGYGGYGAPAAGTSKKAIWSLVLGIVGLCFCGFFTGIPAIILSRSAKSDIARTGQGGSGLATAGLVLGILAIVSGIIGVILVATGNVTFSGDVSGT